VRANVLSSPKPHGFEDRDEVRRLQRDLDEARRKQDSRDESYAQLIRTVAELKAEMAKLQPRLKDKE